MKVKEFGATARVSFKQPTKSGDVFYTFDYTETWGVEDENPNNLPNLKAQLWDVVNNEINQRIISVKNMYKQSQQGE